MVMCRVGTMAAAEVALRAVEFVRAVMLIRIPEEPQELFAPARVLARMEELAKRPTAESATWARVKHILMVLVGAYPHLFHRDRIDDV